MRSNILYLYYILNLVYTSTPNVVLFYVQKENFYKIFVKNY